MRILQIIPSLAKGGAERLVLNICNELSKRKGIEVKLITFKNLNTYSYLTKKIDYQVIISNFSPSILKKHKMDVSELQKQIELFKPDIIHSHLFESEMILSAINFNSSKYFVHFHDNMIQFHKIKLKDLFNKRKITNLFEKQIVLKSYKVKRPEIIAISNDSKTYIDKVLPNSLKKHLLLNAIDLERFNSVDLVEDSKRIVMIASLFEKKGHVLAIETIKELHNRGIVVYLDLLGEGPKKSELQDLIDKLCLNDYVIMHGNVDFPEDYLKNAFLYLHTAIYEPFGLVLIEAMASGLPVVATDAVGNRELIHDGQNGFIHHERDVKKIADSMEKIINDNELKNKLGEGGRKFSKKYGISDYVDKLLTIYGIKTP